MYFQTNGIIITFLILLYYDDMLKVVSMIERMWIWFIDLTTNRNHQFAKIELREILTIIMICVLFWIFNGILYDIVGMYIYIPSDETI